jgi:hypothetical protein
LTSDPFRSASAYSPKLSKVHQFSSPIRSSGGGGRVVMRSGDSDTPQLPTTTVVTPWLVLHVVQLGPQRTARSSCVWLSMKPGATARPVAITSRSALQPPKSPTPTIRSPLIPRSPVRRGAPEPSIRVASRMIVSQRNAMQAP